MFVVISGTNRPGNNSIRVAQIAADRMMKQGAQVEILDLCDLPPELFLPESYGTKPAAFAHFQKAVLEAEGLITVVAEYNGSFPGVLKYFIDMLQYPESLNNKLCTFIGLAAGPWGGLRAVEHLSMVYQYRLAHLFSKRVFIPNINKVLLEDNTLDHELIDGLLSEMIQDFIPAAQHYTQDLVSS